MRPTMVLVENENRKHHSMKNEFKKDGFNIFTAETTDECIERLIQDQVDVVVMDTERMDESPIGSLEKCLNTDRNTKYVLYSAAPHLKMDFRTWAADAFVHKSSNHSNLKTTIKRILHNSS